MPLLSFMSNVLHSRLKSSKSVKIMKDKVEDPVKIIVDGKNFRRDWFIKVFDSCEEDTFDFIEKVVYINLAKRTDRREHMEKLTKVFDNRVIRFEAVEYTPGIIGCAKSHIAVLEMAIENNWKNVLILEDDSEWNDKKEAYECFKKLTKNDFDVLLLGGSYTTYEKDTFKLRSSSCTHAYIIKNHYFSTLLETFKESVILYEKNKSQKYHLDNHWKLLMPKNNWFIAIPNLMYQINGYSDINNTVRSDMSRFIL